MKTKIIFFLIILVSVLLRIYGIEDKNLWFDEVYSWKLSRYNLTDIVSLTSGDIHPPLFYILLKFWTGIFSDSIVSMRMLSAFFGVLSILFLYKLSKIFLKNNIQIFFVVLIYMVSPLNIFYSQEVRMLNLNLFLCLGSVYYFFKFSENQNFKTGSIYVFFSVLAIYTHYFALLIIFSQLVIAISNYFFNGKDRKSLFRSLKYLFTIFIFYIPWISVFIGQVTKGQPWRTEQSIRQVGKNLLDYFKDIFFSSYFTFESNALMIFASIFSIFILLFLVYSFIRILNERSFFSSKINMVLLIFLIPLAIALIISFRQSIVLSRYLSIILPYLFIVLVYFIFKQFKPKAAYSLCIFLILVSCYGTYINYNNKFKNNDYRKIISYLEKNYSAGDVIIAEPHFMGWSIDYYVEHNETNIRKPEVLGWDLNMQIDSLKKLNYINNVWVITDYSSLDNTKYDSLNKLMQDLDFTQKQKKSFYLIPSKVNVEYYTKSQ
ncbi:MAG TPA: glycosyltransferase family 39 protein [Ignavibacteria bacterium]|nr:glycosyltransferase family 39 protein [Ignavibacteria bacterium]